MLKQFIEIKKDRDVFTVKLIDKKIQFTTRGNVLNNFCGENKFFIHHEHLEFETNEDAKEYFNYIIYKINKNGETV